MGGGWETQTCQPHSIIPIHWN